VLEKLFSVLASPLPFLIVISVVITIHELGHYWMGRAFGAAVESFSLGFGSPVIERKDRRGTRWRLNWLPLGGFVKFVGELQTPSDSGSVSPVYKGKAFGDLGPWQRMCIALGGPLANFLFAILVFAAMAMTIGISQAREVRVSGVEASSPAAAVGFQPGDVIVQAMGRDVTGSADVVRATQLRAGEPVSYVVRRDGEDISLMAIPETREARVEGFKVVEKVGRIGLTLVEANVAFRRLNPLDALGYGVMKTGDAISDTVTVIRRLVTGLDGLDKFSGPVGIFGITDNVTDMHMKQADVSLSDRLISLFLFQLQLAAVISIGVGFFNLLPIPVLDGGAVVGCIAEGVTGKQLPEQVQRFALSIGLASLVLFALVITWNDFMRPGGALEQLRGMLS
jgi:regulator of sigma E protease